MATGMFEGQQSDERILALITPHPLAKYLAVGKVIVLSFFLLLVAILIGSAVPTAGSSILFVGILLSIVAFAGGLWWATVTYKEAKTYVTDRRIIRFEAMTPFFVTKRALFWHEALKAKGYAPNLLYRMLGMGHLRVEPHMSEHEDVFVPNIAFYEDLANYIDKILFTEKSDPKAVSSVNPFIAAPRGRRG